MQVDRRGASELSSFFLFFFRRFFDFFPFEKNEEKNSLFFPFLKKPEIPHQG